MILIALEAVMEILECVETVKMWVESECFSRLFWDGPISKLESSPDTRCCQALAARCTTSWRRASRSSRTSPRAGEDLLSSYIETRV